MIRINWLRILILICVSSIAHGELTPGKVTFNAGEVSPLMKLRSDFGKYGNACSELENMFIVEEGAAIRRPGTKYISQVPTTVTFPVTPSAAYEITYISENAQIYGVPITDTTPLTLDVDGIAVDVGDGNVGLPCLGHPFSIDQDIIISGTTNYNGTFTLTAGTSPNELQFTDDFNVETFDANNRVIQRIVMPSGLGPMTQDSSGNLYYGHLYSGGTNVTKIDVNGTIISDFFSPEGGWIGAGYIVNGIEVSSDSGSLYVLVVKSPGFPKLYKFSLTDGSETWVQSVPGNQEIVLDSSDNVYMAREVTFGGKNTVRIYRYLSSTGAETIINTATQYDAVGTIWDIVVTASHIIVVGQNRHGFPTSGQWNVSISDLDGTNQVFAALGGLTGNNSSFAITKGGIVEWDGNIYLVSSGKGHVWKVDTGLNILADFALTFAAGIYRDLWDNLVIVTQNVSTKQTAVFNYYDSDLTFITTLDFYSDTLLAKWVAIVGGAASQGNAAFWPGLTPDTYVPPGTVTTITGADKVVRLIPFTYNKTDAYILGFGNGYMGFFR